MLLRDITGPKRAKNGAAYVVSDELALAAQRGDRAALAELHRKSKGLVRWLVKRYSSTSLTSEDFVQEGWLGFMRALQTWKPQKGTRFNVWMTFWVRAAAANALRKRREKPTAKGRYDRYRDPRDVEAEVHEAICLRQVNEILDDICQADALLIERRAYGATLEEIGKELGVSRERVRQREETAYRRPRAIAKRGDI